MNLLIGIMIPFVGTALGSACVFFLKHEMKPLLQKILLGFASGVMVAASVWSLLIPAMNMSEGMGKLAFIPAAVGIMSAIDILLPVLLPYLVIIVVSTVLVMIVTGLTATAILRRSESKEDQAAEDAELSLEPHETFGIGRRTLSPNGEIDGANGYREILHEKEVQRHASQAEANASGAAQITSAEAERKEKA